MQVPFLISFPKKLTLETMEILMINNFGLYRYYRRGRKMVHLFSKITAEQLLNSPNLIGKLREIEINEIILCRILRQYPSKLTIRSKCV